MLKSSRITVLPGWYFKEEDKIFRHSGVNVSLNENEVDVIATRESAVPFNRTWPGKQRTLDQTELAGLVNFSADEPVNVKVEVTGDVDFDTLLPRYFTQSMPLTWELSKSVTREQILQSWQAWDAHAAHGNTWNLRQQVRDRVQNILKEEI